MKLDERQLEFIRLIESAWEPAKDADIDGAIIIKHPPNHKKHHDGYGGEVICESVLPLLQRTLCAVPEMFRFLGTLYIAIDEGKAQIVDEGYDWHRWLGQVVENMSAEYTE